VQTVTEAGWRGTKDGPLLGFAETRFDVFVTVDRRIESQNNLSRFNMGFVIARVSSNRLEAFNPIWNDLLDAVERARGGHIVHVASGASSG
jgi:hypothetical protein